MNSSETRSTANSCITAYRIPLLHTATSTTLPPYEITPATRPYADRPAADASSVERVKQYLLLLATFFRMIEQVRKIEMRCLHTFGDGFNDNCSIEHCDGTMSGKLGLFVEMAVWRFGCWQERLVAEGSRVLPPLDVLLVWATYTGSPVWYHDDTVHGQKFHPQSVFPDFPLETVCASIDTGDLTYTPKGGEIWKNATGIAFNPIDHFQSSSTASISCPRCRGRFSWPWVCKDGKGYAQAHFSARCPTVNCRLSVSRDAIGVGRLARRLVQIHAATNSQLGVRILTGGLSQHPLDSCFDTTDSTNDSDQEKMAKLGDRWKWDRDRAWAFLVDFSPLSDKRDIFRLMSAYVGRNEASVDLVPSTLRHIFFIDTLNRLGLLEPSWRVVKEDALRTAKSRYTRFLALARNHQILPVPTLGIEIFWQTHLLATTTYRKETQLLVGRMVDRDDAVEESFLAAAFNETAERWKTLYSAPYTTSGLLLPLEVKGVAAKLVSRLHIRTGQLHSSLEGDINYSNPTVYAAVDSTLSLPSERNSVAIIADDKALEKRVLRREKYEECRHKALDRAGKGKVATDLLHGLRALSPPFVNATLEDAVCGPDGYPISPSGLIISGSHISGKANGLVGAGLGRTSDADVTGAHAWQQ